MEGPALAAIAASLAWLAHPDSMGRACIAALVFGFAPAIHNGLFILQFPLVLAFFWAFEKQFFKRIFGNRKGR